MFPDDDRVFPLEKEKTSSVAPVKTEPDDDRARIMEVKPNPSSSQELRSSCL